MASTNIETNPQAVQPNGQGVDAWRDRKSLIDEIVEEMKKDSVKQDASAELKKGSRTERLLKGLSKFFQHQAVLLVIGFGITGYLGSRLANEWQRQEWERQQLRLLDFRGFDRKYQIIDQITNSVGKRNASARAVITPLLDRLSDAQLLKDEEEPLKDWRKGRNEWRVEAKNLQLKIATQVNDPRAAETFDRIVKTEMEIGVGVNRLQSDLVRYNRVDTDEGVRNYVDGILNKIKATEEDLKGLVTLIAEEARNEVKGRGQ